MEYPRVTVRYRGCQSAYSLFDLLLAVRRYAGLLSAKYPLGLGWSATMVAGSTLRSESIPGELRASAQVLSDLVMGLAGAAAGALSGVSWRSGAIRR